MAARGGVESDNAITGGKLGDAFAGLDHGAGQLMSKESGGHDHAGMVAAAKDFEIGTAGERCATRTINSPAAAWGTGTSSMRMSSRPWRTAARMVPLPSAGRIRPYCGRPEELFNSIAADDKDFFDCIEAHLDDVFNGVATHFEDIFDRAAAAFDDALYLVRHDSSCCGSGV